MNRDTVKAYMSAQHMLPPDGGRILVACSGGADSTALLHLLHGMEGVEIICAHFNHRLRGAESDRDEAFVRGLCGDWGIAFYAGSGDVAGFARARKQGVEDAARSLRYRFLRETALEAGCQSIATAHTSDDNAETVLLNLVRGAGARGLSGIPPVRGEATVTVIRPLLNTSRAEIEDYLAEHGLPHVEDSSNAGDDYARNRVRHAVLPALRELNPATVAHLCAAAELLREDEDYFDSLVNEWLREYYRDESLPIPALLNAPRPVAMRVLRRIAQTPGREHLERVYSLCRSGTPHAALDLPTGRVTREYDRLLFSPQPERLSFPKRELLFGETLEIPELKKAVRRSATVYTKEIHNSFNTFYFQSEKICGKICVGPREPGAAIRFAGRNCTKTLKQLFTEAKTPLAERERTIVLYDESGVLAVEGIKGVAERCAPEYGKEVMKIEILER